MTRKSATTTHRSPRNNKTAKSTTPKKSARAKGAARASWAGFIQFGLVAFQVEAFNARSRESRTLVLHQLHAKCHSRIKYDKQCPVHGHVDADEIVSGYEYAKGKYVEIESEELDALRTPGQRALTIDTFVAPEQIDPLFFDGRMYYLLPKGSESQEPYALFHEAMTRKERYGIGQVVFSGKQQIALIRPDEKLLTMAMLNYDAEMRRPAEFHHALAQTKLTDKKVHLAETLIDSWSEAEFDFSKYKDTYFEQLETLIQSKVAGKEVVIPDEAEEPHVVNLMEALQKSLAQNSRRKANSAETPEQHAPKKASSHRKRA